MSIDTSHLKYSPKALRLRFSVKLENWWRGVRDRKNVFKLFCQKLDIDYPPILNKKYSVPETYVVNSDWIQYLGKLRDEVITNQSATYHNANKRTRLRIDEVSGLIIQNEQYLSELKNHLTSLQSRLKSERAKKNKNSLEIISLESSVANQKAKISNCQTDIESVRTDLQILKDIIASNTQSWHKQIDITNALIQQVARKYTVYATKRINKYLNYASFECQLPDYGSRTKEIMEEE